MQKTRKRNGPFLQLSCHLMPQVIPAVEFRPKFIFFYSVHRLLTYILTMNQVRSVQDEPVLHASKQKLAKTRFATVVAHRSLRSLSDRSTSRFCHPILIRKFVRATTNHVLPNLCSALRAGRTLTTTAFSQDAGKCHSLKDLKGTG